MNRLVKYFKEIASCENLERRTSKEWKEVGTKEEFVKMVEFKERKERNSLIYYGSMVAGLVAYLTYNKFQEQKEEESNKTTQY